MNVLYKVCMTILARLLAKEDLDERYQQKITSRYPSLASLILDMINYGSYRLGTPYSYRPISIIIEPLNRCNEYFG